MVTMVTEKYQKYQKYRSIKHHYRQHIFKLTGYMIIKLNLR